MVMQLPEKDELNLTRKQLLAMLDVTMGGTRRRGAYPRRDQIDHGREFGPASGDATGARDDHQVRLLQ